MNNRVTAISYLKLIFWGALAIGIVFLISAVLISCKKSTEEPVPAPPVISSFSPSAGNAPIGGIGGTLITILGSNFSTIPAENEIKFNGIIATANTASNTQLTASVPAGATTGKISVITNGQITTSATDFTVFQSPTITTFSPASGLVGATITISGTNFDSTPASNIVKFNNIAATVSASTTTQLTTTIPAGAITGKITVTTNGQTAISATDFVVFQSPTITTFSPASGLVGVTVTISGTNFDPTPASNIVKFNNTTAAISASTTTQLTTTIPAGATTGKITVTVNGQTATSATDFTLLFQPTISSFTPVYALPGATITVTGTNFSTATANNAVTINGVSADITTATATQLTITVPANATTGKIGITSTTLTATSINDFEVLKDIPRAGLMAYYPFTGNGICSNNSSLNLPISGSNQPTLTADRYGKTDQALNFNGTQSSLIGQPVIPNRPWTICVWMDPGAFNNIRMGFMASHQGSLGIALRLENYSSGDFLIEGLGQNSSGNYSFVTSTAQRYIPGDGSENKWFLIILTYDGSVYKVYKDNVEAYSSNYTADTPPENLFELGSSAVYESTYKYIGKMDDLIIYNRVLNAQELTQLFEQTVSKY